MFRLFVVLCIAAGCGGAFKDSVKRGDSYAQVGMWDKAAAEYQAALKLEPNDTDVQIKLRQVAQRQSGERLVRGKSLIARGEVEAGLSVIQEAAKLDPASTEAQRTLDDANQPALKMAEGLLGTPESTKAFDLTQLVLKGSPRDPRAKQMDDRVRDALAEEAYGRAEKFLTDKKRGNALIEFAACATYRPAFRDVKVQIGDVKLAIEKELTFYVVLDRFAAGTAGEQDNAARMQLDLIAQAFDDRLPLRVVASAPGKEARGVRMIGGLSAYRYGPQKIGTRNAECDYIKGYDTVPNPERARAEHALSDAEQRISQAEREVDSMQ